MRRLTNTQRQAIMKWTCLVLSAALFIGTFFALPRILSLLPYFSARDLGRIFNKGQGDQALPAFAITAGDYDFSYPEDASGEYAVEDEESIPSVFPDEDSLYVFSDNLCWYEMGEQADLHIINRTDYKVDLKDFLERKYPIKVQAIDDNPLVLIVHTHGSESYLPAGQNFYSPDETFRSLKEEETVVHIGEVLAQELEKRGIKAVHDKTMYDQTDFNRSYNYSRAGIKKALEENPSIKYIIDLHRDSVFDSSGKNIKPVTSLNGKDCAQLMLVVGTDKAGAEHPYWRDNLTFATHLQSKLNSAYPTLARPVNLRTSAFNQALSKGSILLEVGSCGNTIEEAENAIKLFAESYCEIIKENAQ